MIFWRKRNHSKHARVCQDETQTLVVKLRIITFN